MCGREDTYFMGDGTVVFAGVNKILQSTARGRVSVGH
jgi:hypothetical protein